MTPEQCALRDAWVSEMWPTCRQYREGDPTPPRKVKVPRKPREARGGPREECPICGVQFQSAYVIEHIVRRHPESVQKPVSDAESGAA